MGLSLDISNSAEAWFEDWRRLWLERSADPFLHPGWHAAFIAARQNGVSTTLLGVREDGKLVGLLPMRRDRDGVLRFLTSPRSDYENALSCANRQEAVISCLADFLVRDRFELAEVPEESPLAAALRACGIPSKLSVLCPGIRLTPEAFHDVTHRKSLRRHERKLSRLGSIRLESVAAADAVEALQHLFEQHISRWLAAGHDSLFLDPCTRDFYHQLVIRPDFTEFATLHRLKVNDIDAAYHLGLIGTSRFIWYKPSFNIALDAEGPGEVLLKLLIELSHAGAMDYFDFTRGDEPFKLRFANEIRRNVRFALRVPIAPRLLGASMRRLADLRRQAVERARRAGRLLWNCMPGSLLKLRVPASRPTPPGGYTTSFGPVDLVAFGALHGRVPQYVTRDRMRLAIERRRRGDRLFVVRRQSDNEPVHFSWLRLSGPAVGESSLSATCAGGRSPAEILDAWTASSRHDPGISDWALQYLAWEAGELGLAPYIWCTAGDFATRLRAARVGMLAT